MKFLAKITLALLVGMTLGTLLAHAADEIIPVSGAELVAWVQSLATVKGGGPLVIILVSVQGIALLLRSPLGKVTGVVRFLAIGGLTIVASVVYLRMTGMDWFAVFSNGAVLAMLQTYAHQFFVQIKKIPEDRKAIETLVGKA